MLLIRCPYCEEERPELEFRHAGEAHLARPSGTISDEDFEKLFFIRSNPKGLIFERWRHVHGCARFFNAARDTVTDKFVITYKAGEPKPDVSKVASGPAAYANRPPDQLNVKKPTKRAPAKKGDAS
jgi:sarcosine oxidase subunit delta